MAASGFGIRQRHLPGDTRNDECAKPIGSTGAGDGWKIQIPAGNSIGPTGPATGCDGKISAG